MRILLVHYDELDTLGGVELLVRRLSGAFTGAGHPSGVVEIGAGWLPRRPLEGQVPIWRIAAASFPSVTRPRSWFAAARSTRQLRRVIREWGADIVHVQFPIGQSIPAVLAHCLPHRWPLAVTVHNSEIRVAPQADPRLVAWQRRLFARADAVTAVSASMLEDTRVRYPAVADKGRVIYNGIGEDWFGTDRPEAGRGADPGAFVLFVGRLHPMKGVDLLLRAWSDLAHAHPGLELRIAGDGPQRAELERLARDAGDRVRFLGALENAALRPLYRDAAAVVLPSRAEGFPLTLLEACACGALCVAAGVPGVTEILEHGRTGLVFAPGSSQALAGALSDALALEAAAAGAMRSAAARTIRERFTESAMVGRYLKLYSDLLARTARLGGSVHARGDR